MLSVAEARERILAQFQPLEAETIGIEVCAGRVLAEDIVADQALPPFDNSSMDGYAVRLRDAAGASAERPVTLPVSADVPAGSPPPGPLAPGTAARIMTGAPMPPGAEAVVPVEDTDDSRDRLDAPVPAAVSIRAAPRPGANVRLAGHDVLPGQRVLRGGTPLTPATIGVLAALGHAQVRVHRQPVVAVFSTGDELRPVEATPGPGQIRDVNSHTLAAAAAHHGARVLRLAPAPDRLEAVRGRLQEAAAAGADIIVSSAGVSVGAYDVVKAAVEAEGGLSLWRVKMRPGKPLAFGQAAGVPFFGLPGNPVSALMSFEVFVRPALMKMAGRRNLDKFQVLARLQAPLQSDGRESYLRVIVERDGAGFSARPAGDQGSAVLSSLARANGLLILPEGVLEARPGEVFTVWLLDGAEAEHGPAGVGT
jgi:molybdopterin molybdotransferase